MEKSDFQGRGEESQKANIYGGERGQGGDLRGRDLARKRGIVFLREG